MEITKTKDEAGMYDCLKLENQLCFPLYACAKEVTRRYKPFLDEIDLTYTQYIAMMVLWERKSVNVKTVHRDDGSLGKKIRKRQGARRMPIPRLRHPHATS